MPALRCWRCASCRDCANFGRPTMSPCRPASPRPRSCSHAWPELCLIPPTSTTTVLSPRGAGCSRPDFHAWTYVVEPVYRDDGLGLWDFGDDAPSSGDPLDLAVDAVRVERRDDPDRGSLDPDVLEDKSKVGR